MGSGLLMEKQKGIPLLGSLSTIPAYRGAMPAAAWAAARGGARRRLRGRARLPCLRAWG